MTSESTRSWDLHPVTQENSKTTIPDLLDLIKALALYEKDPDAVEATPELLTKALFGDEAKGGRKYAECVLAYRGEPGKEGSEPVGMAVYLYVLPLCGDGCELELILKAPSSLSPLPPQKLPFSSLAPLYLTLHNYN